VKLHAASAALSTQLTPRGPAPRRSRARVRLSLALFRGLLLDLVGTEDREGVDAAFEQYRALETIAMEAKRRAGRGLILGGSADGNQYDGNAHP
jgi:hypothetical protein